MRRVFQRVVSAVKYERFDEAVMKIPSPPRVRAEVQEEKERDENEREEEER